MFGSGGGGGSNSLSGSSTASRRASNPVGSSISSPSSLVSGHDASHAAGHPYAHLNREVKQQALAAVLLEEWLLELSAIAQEQSVLQKEQAFEVGMGLVADPRALQQQQQGVAGS